MKNRIFSLLFIVSIIFILCSCDPPSYKYRGYNQSLYTAANHSILGMKTGEMDKVIVLEKDSYGRTLYLVQTRSWGAQDKYIAAIMISQSDSESHVAYYEYDNVIFRYTDFFKASEESASSLFTEHEFSQLKELNDWEKSLSLDKTVKKDICSSDAEVNFISESQLNSVKKEIFGDADDVFSDLMTQCADGKVVCFMGRSLYDKTSNRKEEFYIVIFLPEETNQGKKYIYEKINDLYDCQEQLYGLINPKKHTFQPYPSR